MRETGLEARLSPIDAPSQLKIKVSWAPFLALQYLMKPKWYRYQL